MKIIYTFLLFLFTSSQLFSENNLLVNLNDDSFVTYEIENIIDFNFIINTVSVSGVTLSERVATLVVGDTYQVEFTVQPENANNKNVTFTSSDESKATIDNNGLVSGISTGEVIITVRTEDGGMTDELRLTVQDPVSVEMNEDLIQLYPNPTDGILHINVPNDFRFEIVISDLNGNVVYSGFDKTQIELSSFSTGTYFVSIITNNKYYNYQIIKN